MTSTRRRPNPPPPRHPVAERDDARQQARLARRISTVAATVGFGLIGFLYFFPLLWMFASSMKSNREIFSRPFSLPAAVDFSSWQRAWDVGNIGRYALNSVVVTGASVVGILLLASAAAFGLSRYAFASKRVIQTIFAVGLVLPVQSYFIAQSSLFTELDLIDTRLALIIPYTAIGLPLAVYLLKMFMDGLPEELFDAAAIDGAGDLRMFLMLALPLMRPGLATVAIFSALSSWNEFLLALLYIQDDDLKTIPVGLLAFSSRYVTDYTLLFSALTIVTLPMIAVYIVFNKQMTEGITAGSLK